MKSFLEALIEALAGLAATALASVLVLITAAALVKTADLATHYLGSL